ncbi:hypothetical protein [Thauera humireducens]|uniref:alpha/beta fold hydrolase n=1 Tax=Thauera humireducens TaxID=1134435 RepID=UPI00311D2FAB
MTRNFPRLDIQDHWFESGSGRLYVRAWSPESAVSDTPIILLHDSLGSVELWRDFPAALCVETGRQVLAYDRLGFGRSDAHPGKLPLDFVAREAEAGFDAVRRQLGLGASSPSAIASGAAWPCIARHVSPQTVPR